MSEQEPDSAVFRAYKAHLESNGGTRGQFNLDTLWEAKARKQGHAPRQWAARQKRHGKRWKIANGPRDEPMGDFSAFLAYGESLCSEFHVYTTGLMGKVFLERPGKTILESKSPLMGMIVAGAVAGQTGMSREEAKRHIMRDVLAETEGLGMMAQETKVAQAQRSLDGKPALEVFREPELDHDQTLAEFMVRQHGEILIDLAARGDDTERVGVLVPYEAFHDERTAGFVRELAELDGPYVDEQGIGRAFSFPAGPFLEYIREAYPSLHTEIADDVADALDVPGMMPVVVVMVRRTVVAGITIN